jgi:hypothetical protein
VWGREQGFLVEGGGKQKPNKAGVKGTTTGFNGVDGECSFKQFFRIFCPSDTWKELVGENDIDNGCFWSRIKKKQQNL